MNLIKKLCKKTYQITFKVLRKILSVLKRIVNKIRSEFRKIKMNLYYKKQIKKALEIIKTLKQSEYIVLYNPTWLGVANSTKGLFEYIVPLEQVYSKKDAYIIAQTIIDSGIKQVVFSQLVDGWVNIIKELKKIDNTIDIKVIWHANNSEVMSDYTWPMNKELLELYDNKLVNAFAFVKKSMVEFYNKVGYKSLYLSNNVKSFALDNKGSNNKKKNKEVKIGIYNASSREIKNIYTQLNAINLLGNAKADIVPSYKGVIDFLDIIKLKYDHLPDYIPTEELMNRIKENDLNVYITFTECSPMFPIESFEAGVPCLIGNNNDYFQNTKLGEYVIVSREDDASYIRDRMALCLKNRDEIMNLYKEWKINFDKECQNNVKEFIKFK